ncbi:MAG TPA: beta-galactosidase [Prosthecobacter sp.]|nr:beta-galactosidase [Prosthecobacter sp.]
MKSSLALLLFLAFTSVFAADLKPVADGIAIEAGTLGSFTLTYPEFLDAAHAPVHKKIESVVTGSAAKVRYEAGAQVAATVANGEIHLQFENLPPTVKSWKMTMLIDIGFAKGGEWQAGESKGVFPLERPEVPHFHSANGSMLRFKNAQGQSLAFTLPEYAFQQLTDNREWNWAVYQWQFIVPAHQPSAVIKVAADLTASAKLVDAFGQSIPADYPGKLKSIEELKADAAADAAYYGALTPPPADRFGGLPGSGEKLGLKKTGFFHVEQKQGKWWLVDPDGNAFFHLGICGFVPSDDYTYVKGREGIYEWLPKVEGEFASAFRPGNGDENFSFYVANTIRKFGEPYSHDAFAARMIERVRKWGFNSIGAFSPTPPTAHTKASFPYVAHLPINEWEGVPRIPGAHEVWDPFDEATAAKIAANIASELPARAQDPLLIGWFIVNEPRYDDLPRVIPSLPANHACKQRLVQALRDKYKSVEAFNTAWQAQAKSFEELAGAGLAVITDAAKADVKAFVSLFLETYFQQITDAFRRHDPNHLLIGSRLQPITIEDEALCRIMGRHLDVVSYNYYTYAVDAEALKRYHNWTGGKPMMLSEFFWSSPRDSGLVGGRELGSQQERGLAYRNYVEQSAALGFVVGIEWFTLVDQAVTGRWFSRYNGESYNTGLFSVADRPWKPMLAEMMKTNYGIYEILLGQRPPFKWEDERFTVKRK